MGIKSLFLIQPIPGWGKPLTENERVFAQGADRKLYKEMTDHVVGLREQLGIPVYSLLDVFQDTKEEIYKDQAHVNELGNEIMARRVADLIAEVWGWPRKRTATTGHRRLEKSITLTPGQPLRFKLASIAGWAARLPDLRCPNWSFGACGAAVLCRRRMVEEIGFLDEDFFLYDEDTDLNFRAQLAGWKCSYVPTAEAPCGNLGLNIRYPNLKALVFMINRGIFYEPLATHEKINGGRHHSRLAY